MSRTLYGYPVVKPSSRDLTFWALLYSCANCIHTLFPFLTYYGPFTRYDNVNIFFLTQAMDSVAKNGSVHIHTCISIFFCDMDITLLVIIAKYSFPIRKWALLYQVLFGWGVYEQKSIVKSDDADDWTAEWGSLLVRRWGYFWRCQRRTVWIDP